MTFPCENFKVKLERELSGLFPIYYLAFFNLIFLATTPTTTTFPPSGCIIDGELKDSLGVTTKRYCFVNGTADMNAAYQYCVTNNFRGLLTVDSMDEVAQMDGLLSSNQEYFVNGFNRTEWVLFDSQSTPVAQLNFTGVVGSCMTIWKSSSLGLVPSGNSCNFSPSGWVCQH